MGLILREALRREALEQGADLALGQTAGAGDSDKHSNRELLLARTGRPGEEVLGQRGARTGS